jgi:hypothetical protein
MHVSAEPEVFSGAGAGAGQKDRSRKGFGKAEDGGCCAPCAMASGGKHIKPVLTAMSLWAQGHGVHDVQVVVERAMARRSL